MSRIFKSSQVNIGVPFEVELPDCLDQLMRQRAQSSDESLADGVCADSGQLKSELEKAVEQANAEAVRILEEAEATARMIREQSKKEGYEEGYAKGYSEGKSEYEGLVKEAEELKLKGQEDYKALLEGAERDMIDLVLKVCAKILGEEVRIDREKAAALIGEAVKKCAWEDNIIIRVSPDDYGFLEGNREKLAEYCKSDMFEIRSDASVAQGGCIIETRFGSVDAGIDAQLEQIREAFNELLV